MTREEESEGDRGKKFIRMRKLRLLPVFAVTVALAARTSQAKPMENGEIHILDQIYTSGMVMSCHSRLWQL